MPKAPTTRRSRQGRPAAPSSHPMRLRSARVIPTEEDERVRVKSAEAEIAVVDALPGEQKDVDEVQQEKEDEIENAVELDAQLAHDDEMQANGEQEEAETERVNAFFPGDQGIYEDDNEDEPEHENGHEQAIYAWLLDCFGPDDIRVRYFDKYHVWLDMQHVLYYDHEIRAATELTRFWNYLASECDGVKRLMEEFEAERGPGSPSWTDQGEGDFGANEGHMPMIEEIVDDDGSDKENVDPSVFVCVPSETVNAVAVFGEEEEWEEDEEEADTESDYEDMKNFFYDMNDGESSITRAEAEEEATTVNAVAVVEEDEDEAGPLPFIDLVRPKGVFPQRPAEAEAFTESENSDMEYDDMESNSMGHGESSVARAQAEEEAETVNADEKVAHEKAVHGLDEDEPGPLSLFGPGRHKGAFPLCQEDAESESASESESESNKENAAEKIAHEKAVHGLDEDEQGPLPVFGPERHKGAFPLCQEDAESESASESESESNKENASCYPPTVGELARMRDPHGPYQSGTKRCRDEDDNVRKRQRSRR